MKILLMLMMVISAQAGIQGVGKGGGYGEMQAYSANLAMSRLAQICISNPASCGLADGHELQRAVSINFDLTFDPSCQIRGIVVLSATSARISSCDLYLVGTQPKAFVDIANLVLQARLRASGTEGSRASTIAAAVFSGMSQSSQMQRIDLPLGNFVVHALTISLRKQAETLVSIEGRQMTIDLSKQVKAALACATAATIEVNLSATQVLADSQGVAIADVHWICATGDRWSGQLQIFFESTPTGEVNSTATQVRIVNKARF